MARYYGDFRSIDTSNDPKGQQYRVLIFTGYNGTNPYEYQYYRLPTETMAGAKMPVVGTRLTMAAHPFTVSYEGDSDNIFKPYRCSTAQISFLQSDINLDFLSANGQSTLVVLLKWKNKVSEINGHMYNNETGETLYKKRITDNILGAITTIFNDYEPYKYDKFCYNVEWVGFATPETFSMAYDHERDVFTLNAQDALSALQFSKYNWLGEDYTTTALDILLSCLSAMGVYRHVYITKAIRRTDSTDNPLSALTLQQKNWYDEDGKATDQLAVIAEIMRYLNLTAITYQDSLVITHPAAIANGWNYYDCYNLPNTEYILNWPADTALSYTQGEEIHLASDIVLSRDTYRGGDMTIETGNIYYSVTVTCEEYPVETTLPDIEDENNVTAKGNVRMEDISFVVSGGSFDRYHWERQYFQSDTERIKLYQYVGNTYNNSYGTDEITDPEQQIYGYADSLYRPYCVIVDDGGCGSGSATQALKTPYKPNRKYFFNTPNITTRPSSQPWQPLLYIRTEPIMFNNTDYLQLKGDWTFFVNSNHNFDQIPYQQEDRNETTVNSYMYILAKVKCGDKWLANGTVTYKWQSAETTVKLYLAIDDGKAFGRTFHFNGDYRNIEQAVVKLPVSEGNVLCAPVEIWFNRPLGVSSTPCRNATLDNLELNVISADEVANRNTSNRSNTNTEYQSEMAADAVSEYSDISLKLSSITTKSARYSQTALATDSGLKKMPSVYHVATGTLAIPESQIANNIVAQYSTATIGLNFAVPASVAPYSRLTWARMGARKFVVDAANYDFADDRAELAIREVKTTIADAETTQSDTTRRYRRNRDFLTDEITPRHSVLLATEFVAADSRTISVSGGIAQITTDSETEGLITIQPSFADGSLLVSIPNDIEGATAAVADEQLTLSFE